MTYALWLVPSEPEFDALQCLMKFRPQQYNPRTHLSRSYLRFDPHVTLATLPSRPSLPLAELLPSMKETSVYFESINVWTSYPGSLYIILSRSPELMKLRDGIVGHLKNVHRIRASSHAFPRMPLFIPGSEETIYREQYRLANVLRSSGRVIERRGAGVALDCTLDGAAPKFNTMAGFLGSEIWLVESAGGAADWRVLEKRKLIRRGPRIPMNEAFSYVPHPVIPVGHPGMRECMPPAPCIQRRDPWVRRQSTVPVIPLPVIPHYSKEPRGHTYHHAQVVGPNITDATLKRRLWTAYHDYRQ